MVSEKDLRAPSSRAAAIASMLLREREREVAAAAAAAAAVKRARKPPVQHVTPLPKSLKTNSLRAEALFRHLPQSSLLSYPASSPHIDKKSFALRQLEQVGDGVHSSMREQGLRRSNRTTGDKKEEWIKIPVEASVCVEGSDPQTLDGFVYLSSENLQLYKRGGLVFFETFWKGGCYNFQVLEEQLPMLTTEHPLYVAELAKIEEMKNRKLHVISELVKLSCSNVDLEYDMEVLAIEHSHSKDLLALKFQLLETMTATGEQSPDCNPPAHLSTTDNRLFAIQQPRLIDDQKAQDQPILPKPVAGDVCVTHVFPVLGRTYQSQSHSDSCDFDEVLLPTPLPAVTTNTSSAKSVSRKRIVRNQNDKCVTGAGDSIEEMSRKQKRQKNNADEDKDGEYIHIVDFFQARLLQNRPVAKNRSRRNREKMSS
ncbi:hypothetical protein VYU27_003783 [Nannochloropsis oceanica]